ncbi:hypothetical protein ACE3LH_16640 [Enterobacter hormaechei subsp. steigerwaltii]
MSATLKEWLVKTITELEEERDAVPGVVNEDAAMALAAMKLALASLEARSRKLFTCSACGAEGLDEPLESKCHCNEDGAHWIESVVYTAPPAPVSDSLLSELLGIAKRAADEADECAHAEFSDDSMKHSAAIVDWERRAAMLQGAEPVKTANKLPFEQWLSQQTGTIDVECGCVKTEVFFHWLRVAHEAGDSPVIPDGWVLVPEEPTHEMLEAGDEQFGTYDVYRRMIAASPQQK